MEYFDGAAYRVQYTQCGYTAHIMSHTHADRIETCIEVDDDDDDDIGLSFIVVI